MQSTSPLLRQWSLLRAIAADGDATVKSLVGVTGMSDKTIRRDIAVLRRVGFPIEERSGDFGRKTFSLVKPDTPQLQFAYDEALALYLCRRSTAGFKGTFVDQALSTAFCKIEASLGRRAAKYVETMLGRIVHTQLGGDYADKAEMLDRLFIAIEEERAVFLTYQSQRATEPVTYDVYPYRIVDHRGSLYLLGNSPDHDELRTWKLDRMTDVGLTDVHFQRRDEPQAATLTDGAFGIFSGKGDVHVRIRFAPSAARYVSEKRMHASQRVEPQPDGSAIVEFRLSNTTEVKAWILSFGAAAKVLEPQELRNDIVHELSTMTRSYSSRRQIVQPLLGRRKR
ncbi:MAG TPA: WYL domain-containing protein [Pirellulales bacterium]|jgi:proteasome accessory factor B|nr:WYL domain-containing protein [Pirellulales bacterium]